MKEQDNIIDKLIDIIQRKHIGYTVFRQIGHILTPENMRLFSPTNINVLKRIRCEEMIDSAVAITGKKLPNPPKGHILEKSLFSEAIENKERR